MGFVILNKVCLQCSKPIKKCPYRPICPPKNWETSVIEYNQYQVHYCASYVLQ